jgi:hypothetical protein
MAPWIKAKNGNVFEVEDVDLAARQAKRDGSAAFETDPREGEAKAWHPGGEPDLLDPTESDQPSGEQSEGRRDRTEGIDAPTEPTARSTKAEWTAWAKHLGLDVPKNAKIDTIKAVVAEHAAAAQAATAQTGGAPEEPLTDEEKARLAAAGSAPEADGQPASATTW